jgi:hypothetical protein
MTPDTYMKRFLLCTVAIASMAFAHADDLKKMEFTPDPASNGNAAQASCDFSALGLPKDVVVYATGAYAGSKTNYQIDQSGHEATRFDVAVNSPNKPVVLMLSAYEPSVWNVGWTPGTRILAAVVTGYHRQGVAGLPADTPFINSSYDNRGPCGSFYLSDSNMAELNPLARRLLGRPVTMVYPISNGKVVVGTALAGKAELLTSSAVSIDSFRDLNAPLAGEAGLEAALRKGELRRATAADAQAWADAQAKQGPAADLPPVAGSSKPKVVAPSFHNGYVVLKPIAVPAGLYGAHSATFFVPKGVPAPTGNLGHSTLYDHNTLSCKGTSCRR